MEIKELLDKTLYLDVSGYIEERDGLSYLSWSYAWQEMLKLVPDATYEVRMFKQTDGTELPYCGNPKHGYMVFTSVTACGVTRECYLPVMDSKNKAMKDEPYTYTTKTGEKTVEAMTMFDVNKALMRCLAKNCAMFGLGLYVYNGADLPEKQFVPITDEQKAKFKELGVNEVNVLKRFKVKSIDELSVDDASFVIASKQKAVENAN